MVACSARTTGVVRLCFVLLLLFLGGGCVRPLAEESSTSPAVTVATPLTPSLPAFVAMTGEAPTPTVSSTLTQICAGNQREDFDCYERHYQGLVAKGETALAFADLKARYEEPYIKSQCHPLTHVIGRAAVKQYQTVSEAYQHGDSVCWSGYYHGVMEGIVARVGRNNLVSQLNTLCADVPGKDRYSFDYFNCVHGLGHGLMAMTNDELFESLKICDSLNGQWEKSSCYGGVFMENIIVDGKNHYTKYLDPKRLLYPCTDVDTPYKEQCYLMQTSYILKETNGDFARGFAECRNADANFRSICFQSLGRDASGRTVSSAEATKKICESGQTRDEKSNCVVGAVKDFISYFHDDVEAKRFCGILEKDLQTICSGTAESYYKLL